jgi:hypothetical protein
MLMLLVLNIKKERHQCAGAYVFCKAVECQTEKEYTCIDQEHVFFFREENVVVLHMNTTSEFQGLLFITMPTLYMVHRSRA